MLPLLPLALLVLGHGLVRMLWILTYPLRGALQCQGRHGLCISNREDTFHMLVKVEGMIENLQL